MLSVVYSCGCASSNAVVLSFCIKRVSRCIEFFLMEPSSSYPSVRPVSSRSRKRDDSDDESDYGGSSGRRVEVGSTYSGQPQMSDFDRLFTRMAALEHRQTRAEEQMASMISKLDRLITLVESILVTSPPGAPLHLTRKY
nr:ORF4 [Chuviridae sp.]